MEDSAREKLGCSMTEHQNSRHDLPRPHRTISGTRLVARPRAEEPAPEITVGFTDEEAPTANLPSPVLSLLLRASMATEQNSAPEAPTAAAPETPAEPAAKLAPESAPRRRGSALFVCVSVLIGAIVGVVMGLWASADGAAAPPSSVGATTSALPMAPPR